MNPDYFIDYFLIFVCNVIGSDGVPPDGVVFPTTTTTDYVQLPPYTKEIYRQRGRDNRGKS